MWGLGAPWFLAGLAAVALPVWLHLLRKHKSTPLPFSSLMFFERRTQSSIQHRRLQYLLLFSLRALLLILLALAFAGPFITGGALPAGGRAEAGGAGHRQLLQHAAGQSLEPGPARKRFSLLSRLRTRRSGAGAGLRARGAVDERADQRPGRAARRGRGHQAGRFAQFLRRPGARAAQHRPIRRGCRSKCICSATCRRASMPPGFAELALPAGASLKLHAVADSRHSELDRRKRDRARAASTTTGKARVQATVAGFGTEAATLRASLVVNGKVARDQRASTCRRAGRATVEFQSLDAPHGLNRGEVRLEASDAFPADDRFLFSVERSDPSRVLFVHEARDTRSATYFRAALEASSQATFALETRRSRGQLSGVRPSNYAFVVLVERRLPAARRSKRS